MFTPKTAITDPLGFVGVCWPKLKLYKKQREAIVSVAVNLGTYVPSANEMGKTFIAALTAVWFFATRKPGRVIMLSASQDHIRDVIFPEMRRLIETSQWKFPFDCQAFRVLKLNEKGEPGSDDYIVGHTTARVESFHGTHLPHDIPRILVIFDEASAIADGFNEAADSFCHRKLVIGNPMNIRNFFYRECRFGDTKNPGGDGLLRKIIHIDGDESPNVIAGRKLEKAGIGPPYPIIIPGILSYPEYLIREQQWDSVQKTVRLHGRFYEGADQLMFPSDYLDGSERRWRELEKVENRNATAIGVDTGAGRDLTVITIIDHLGILKIIAKKTRDTTLTSGLVIRAIWKHKVKPHNVFFDSGGGGKEIADRLREQGYRVSVIAFGGPTVMGKGKRRIQDQREVKNTYKNRRAEMYGVLRSLMAPDREGGPFAIPPESHLLRQELAILPLTYDSEGRLILPPKDPKAARLTNQKSLREMLGRSPDYADSLVLATQSLDPRVKMRPFLMPSKHARKLPSEQHPNDDSNQPADKKQQSNDDVNGDPDDNDRFREEKRRLVKMKKRFMGQFRGGGTQPFTGKPMSPAFRKLTGR